MHRGMLVFVVAAATAVGMMVAVPPTAHALICRDIVEPLGAQVCSTVRVCSKRNPHFCRMRRICRAKTGSKKVCF